jgi:hypothetical protein
MSIDRHAAARAAVISTLDVLRGGPDERFDRVTRAAREAFEAPVGRLNIVDATHVRALSPVGPNGMRDVTTISNTFCGTTIQSTEMLVVEDARLDPRFANLNIVRSNDGVRFYAGVPLSTPGGTIIGTLSVMDSRPRRIDAERLSLLAELGRWAERVLGEGHRSHDFTSIIKAARPDPLELPGWHLASQSVGGHDMEGGFADWSRNGDSVAITVADVLGDGHGAAVLAASVRSAIRARADRPALEAVEGTDAQLADELSRAASHVALFHARFDLTSGALDWVDAGLGVAVLGRADGSSEVLRTRDLPIGLQPTDLPRSSGTTVIRPGDSVLVASPGLLRLHDGTLNTLDVASKWVHGVTDFDPFFAEIDRQSARRGVLEGITAIVVARD